MVKRYDCSIAIGQKTHMTNIIVSNNIDYRNCTYTVLQKFQKQKHQNQIYNIKLLQKIIRKLLV